MTDGNTKSVKNRNFFILNTKEVYFKIFNNFNQAKNYDTQSDYL
ncbi:hypothetical protein KL86DYS2_12703 [uncultured Dysgonomonas sp.]|uniref:Uncharacterized protein n=2 Tax=Bacteroidota TaxID=976 RepID=A0A654BJJ6_SPHMU|nr:hypothetical protein KL86DYS2_12703 [uncultured Dysgonomonas sp.]VXC80763.1 conserved hypothetical protein [Sphingobacterium multivorum]